MGEIRKLLESVFSVYSVYSVYSVSFNYVMSANRCENNITSTSGSHPIIYFLVLVIVSVVESGIMGSWRCMEESFVILRAKRHAAFRPLIEMISVISRSTAEEHCFLNIVKPHGRCDYQVHL